MRFAKTSVLRRGRGGPIAPPRQSGLRRPASRQPCRMRAGEESRGGSRGIRQLRQPPALRVTWMHGDRDAPVPRAVRRPARHFVALRAGALASRSGTASQARPNTSDSLAGNRSRPRKLYGRVRPPTANFRRPPVGESHPAHVRRPPQPGSYSRGHNILTRGGNSGSSLT